MADDLNDFVGVMDTYEMVQTPNLDKLARQATIFENVGNRYALTVVMQKNDENLHFGLRSKSWRYIKYASGKEELYNHKEDPYEQNNIARIKEFKKEKFQLQQTLEQLIN